MKQAFETKRESVLQRAVEAVQRQNNGLCSVDNLIKYSDQHGLNLVNRDVKKCVARWQRQELRQKIGRLMVCIKDGGKTFRVRAEGSLLPDRRFGKGYRGTGAILSKAEHRRALIDDYIAQIVRLEVKVRTFRELAPIFDARCRVLRTLFVAGSKRVAACTKKGKKRRSA